MPQTSQISLSSFYHPRQNLLAASGQNEPEEEFVSAFVQTYLEVAPGIHRGSPKTKMLMAREIPINGLGIADVLTLSWAPTVGPQPTADVTTAEELRDLAPTIHAFEAKMTNWRKGLMQAHRYSFFADASVLVIPVHMFPVVERSLPNFRKLCVGLWVFDADKRSIRAVYTPRPRVSPVPKYRQLALSRMAEALRAQPVSETTRPPA